MSMLYKWEYTDTFGGEANYSWVRRGTFNVKRSHDPEKENRSIARKAKAAAGLTGIRGRSYWHGDQYEFRPYRMATVLFADYYDE